ncbi:DUF397 domain-containing protein [Streptomyces sp. E11-3]|uniref:DUF397 domain-containing protein n=1 Tax=Streptomyces sp. E11-3 TaxID=3110112 RepID=UPI0039804777
MSQLAWQKSSYSTSGESECVELATGPTGLIHLRESDAPGQIATTTTAPLSALLTTLKQAPRKQG